MPLLVDDQELSRRLRSNQTPARDEVFTTGLWYVRLCQAVMSQRGGVLSKPILALPEARRAQALRAIMALPEGFGLVSLRELGPLVGQLRLQHRLNLLGAEALAAAMHLHAEVQLTVPSPALEAALSEHDCNVRRLYTDERKK